VVVLLDALGTLVELQPPAPRLRARLGEAGFEVTEERAETAIRAEIAYYLTHHLDGSDRDSLDDLRDRCAAVMREALGIDGLDQPTARQALMGALEFRPYEDTIPALRELRADGYALAVVSNWDCALPDWLREVGVLELVDAVVTSAEVGVAKPDARVFRRALELTDAGAAEAVHVGDSPDNDVAGARAAGIRAVLLRRNGDPPSGVESISSLCELAPLL
jgi:HAD superfamily hydrolase (TIGR01549 family)